MIEVVKRHCFSLYLSTLYNMPPSLFSFCMEVHSHSIREQFGTSVEPKEPHRLGAARITDLPSLFTYLSHLKVSDQINVNIKDNLSYTF